MHWSYSGSWWAWSLMALVMAAFWALVIWGVMWLLRSTSRPSGPGPTERSAEAVLAERFATGEIDEAEYRSRLEALRATGTGSTAQHP